MGLVALLGLALFWLLAGGSLRFDSGPNAAGGEPANDSDPSLRAKKVLGGDVQALLADRGASISGRVLDPSGKPIAGATVCANTFSQDLSTVQTRLPTCTKAGPTGHYRIEGLFRVRYGVGAAASHHIPDRYNPPGNRDFVELARTPEATGIDITLKPGGVEVRGVVRDVSGGEIEGAWVSRGEGWRWGGGGGVGTRSDAKGEFSLWAKKGSLHLSATAEGYAPGGEEGVAPGHYFEILLTPESVLVGKVIAKATGKPVEGAKVHASGSWDNRWGGNTTFSDADGRFRIDRLEPGIYKPMAEVDGAFGMAESSVHLGLAQTSEEVIIEVHRAATVTGRVVLSGSKESEGCDLGWISLTDKAAGLMRFAELREGGEVEITAVLPGKYEVKPECENAVARKDYPPVEVADEDVHGLEWEVDPGLSIRGIVVDPAGEPAEEVNVNAQMKGGDPRGQRPRAWSRTEEDGTFELTGLLPGTYHLNIYAWEIDYVAPIEPTTVTLEAGQDLEGVRIELEASGSIAGTVEDEQGEPLANVQVHAMALERGWGGNRAKTADNGAFEIKAVRPGEYRVSASQGWRQQLREPGKGDDDVQGEVVRVTSGNTAEVTLVLERKDGVIRGQVVDEDGGPVSDAFLAAERESESAAASGDSARRSVRWGWDRKPVLSDQDGRFEIGDLAPGKYTVHANRRGGGEGIVEHVEVGADVTVRIEPTAKLAGTVKVQGGAGLERFTVMVRERKKAIWRRDQCFKTGGKWSVDGLPAGTYEVSAEAPEGTGERKGIELAENEERTDIVIELGGKGTIRGSVVDLETGEPVPGRRVSASSLSGGGGGFMIGDESGNKEITDEQGRFEVEHVPAGKIRIMVMPQSFDMDDEYGFVWGATAEAKAGEVTEIPPIKLVKRRTERQGRGGDLGFKIKEGGAEQEFHQTPLEVAFIRPGGPAAQADLKVGDIITAVDGHDVSGENRYLYYGLARVPEGTTLSFTLKRGTTIQITAGKPL